MKQIHELRCWPKFYEHVISGAKPFEVRKDDRSFCVGDTLRLREWSPDGCEYSGRECDCEVTSVLRPLDHDGVAPGFCVMGLRLMYVDTGEP